MKRDESNSFVPIVERNVFINSSSQQTGRKGWWYMPRPKRRMTQEIIDQINGLLMQIDDMKMEVSELNDELEERGEERITSYY